jgi:plasmid stability protein
MHLACEYATNMKMVQVRNVPEPLHRTLKARAALAGMSLSEYLLAELRRIAARPSREELLERLRGRESVHPKEPVTEAVAAERQAH